MKKIIMFDFDGVIVDSFDLSLSIIRRSNAKITADQYRAMFNGNVYDFQDRKDAEVKIKAVDDFFCVYAKKVLNLECVFGMSEIIEKLAKEYILVIVSSTRESIIDNFLQKNNLKQYFSEILGPETHKNKTKKMRMIFEKYDVLPEECLFVTDTVGDIGEAREANVECVAVAWGFHSQKTLKEVQSYAIAENPSQLLEFIR